MREYLAAVAEDGGGEASAAPRLLLEGGADAAVDPAATASFVARQLDRPLFRLDLALLHRPEEVAPSITALLAAAANVGAVVWLEEMDVLIPAADRPARQVGEGERWRAQLTALVVREALHAHPLPVIVGAVSTDRLHRLLARGIDLTVSLTSGGPDDR